MFRQDLPPEANQTTTSHLVYHLPEVGTDSHQLCFGLTSGMSPQSISQSHMKWHKSFTASTEREGDSGINLNLVRLSPASHQPLVSPDSLCRVQHEEA